MKGGRGARRHKRGGVKVVGREDEKQGDIKEEELGWCEGRMRGKET